MHDVSHGKGIKKSFKSQAKKGVKRIFSKVARGKAAARARGSGAKPREVFHRLKK